MKRLLLPISLLLMECRGELKIQPISTSNVVETTVLPDFNFRVRVPSGIDIIKSTEFQNFSIYIKQLDFTVSNQTYFISFQPTNGFDGNIEFDKKLYLPNDLIEIKYDLLKNNEVIFKYLPIKPAIGSYQIQFYCYDKAKRNKTFVRNITVNP